jgi:ABC-type multidrug transport system fused ATPase/permease subunit
MELFDKIDVVGSEFIQENSKGHILSRQNNDLMCIKEFVSFRFPEIYAQILLIVLVLVLILMADWRLGLVYLAILPIYAICLYVCHVKSKTNFNGHQKHLGRMMGYFERGLENRDSFHEIGFEKINQTVIR